MRRINILYVITKLELGGAQKQLLSLVTHLDATSFAPTLFTTQDGLLMLGALSIKGLKLKKSLFLRRRINPPAESISEKLALLLNDESLRKKIGQNAMHSLGDVFRLKNMIKHSQNLYNDLIRETGYAH